MRATPGITLGTGEGGNPAGIYPTIRGNTASNDVLMDRFTEMVRNGREGILASWLDEAEGSMIASFARGLRSGSAALAAAPREPWSNGQTEGQINRLKALKRQMYGRTNIDLLRARLLAPA